MPRMEFKVSLAAEYKKRIRESRILKPGLVEVK